MTSRSWLISLSLFGHLACSGGEPTSELADTTNGYARLMDSSRENAYRQLLPQVADTTLAQILNSDRTMWYDKQSIVPGYQDSFGSPKGMRPNTISNNLIDLAVPGGHAKLFRENGHFHFPFGSGGVDHSTNVSNVFFWSAPEKDGKVLPVVYWVTNWDRWQWMFPAGTVLGEVLMVTFPDQSKHVFEIRTRTRTLNGWTNDVLRPFRSAEQLADAIKQKRPDWAGQSQLAALVAHLEDQNTLIPKSLVAKQYPGTFAQEGYLDTLPSFGDAALAKELLTGTTFKSVKGAEWKRSGDKVTFAPDTKDAYGITGNNYDGGLFEVSDQSCSRCHVDAGRSFQDFHPDVAAYGELWGEDQAFSWHLFENDRFVKSDGSVRCFNADPGAGCSVDDNRALRQAFKDSGLVAPYNLVDQEAGNYKRLPQSWTYKPF